MNRNVADALERAVFVSIRTRPEGRVNPTTIRRSCPATHRFNPHPARGPGESSEDRARDTFGNCFNPHPARGPGESKSLKKKGARMVVSIRTRPEGRVNQLSCLFLL